MVAQGKTAFNDNWIKTTGRVLNGTDDAPELAPAGDSDAQLFVASPSGGSESMHLMDLIAIAAARTSIDLAAASCVPDALITRSLLEARSRGVKMRVLLPGKHIDAISVRLASKASWEPLLQAGIDSHEDLPTMLHTKLLIIDSLLVSVGSTNFDIRSFRLNDEASVNVYNRALAAQMTAAFERDLQQAERYTLERWRARPLRQNLGEKLVRPFRSQVESDPRISAPCGLGLQAQLTQPPPQSAHVHQRIQHQCRGDSQGQRAGMRTGPHRTATERTVGPAPGQAPQQHQHQAAADPAIGRVPALAIGPFGMRVAQRQRTQADADQRACGNAEPHLRQPVDRERQCCHSDQQHRTAYRRGQRLALLAPEAAPDAPVVEVADGGHREIRRQGCDGSGGHGESFANE
ncbi:phospholipase [Xanthomonas oryzae pv. oryzae]|uniref:Phospholipase D active site domain protein n=1 Tax=Xanthomonas oryzae pv. oryzae (strain PXO99A) TaxID=360094 RepID=A0A0K0GRI0_XANOP|nr:phospholipase D active site domain protein [Xanthomonas oryzae pv. oryzae PXO99A]AXM41814.1 phospholipase [Xanthomonas oryzae pv. oryzae]RBK65268.1 phospholipase [Xanthomonas oryzae pv. oryzae]UEQ19912.1 phospholipase [Xanthomonas oryzae]